MSEEIGKLDWTKVDENRYYAVVTDGVYRVTRRPKDGVRYGAAALDSEEWHVTFTAKVERIATYRLSDLEVAFDSAALDLSRRKFKAEPCG